MSCTLRDRRVENVLLLERPFEHAFDKSPRAFTRLRVRELHQYIMREAAREGCGGIPEMLEHEREAKIGEQLEAPEALAARLQGSLEQCPRLLPPFPRPHRRRPGLRQRTDVP